MELTILSELLKPPTNPCHELSESQHADTPSKNKEWQEREREGGGGGGREGKGGRERE